MLGLLREPLALLFPEGSLATAEALYQHSPIAAFYGRLVQGAVAELRPGRLSVLEVGAGTGGTTAYVLEALSDRPVDYLYTDLSPGLLHKRGAAGPNCSIRCSISKATRPSRDWEADGSTC